MKIPTAEEIKAARDRIRAKGGAAQSDDIIRLCMLPVQNPQCRECTEAIAEGVLVMLEIAPELLPLLQGAINGAFVAGLHLGLEI